MSVSQDIVKTVPFFQNLSEDESQALSSICEKLEMKKGAVLFEEKEKADCFYVLLKGKISIKKKINSHDEITLAVLKENDLLGEMDVLSQVARGRMAKAEIAEDAVLLKINKEYFLKAWDECHPFANKIIFLFAQMLSERLRVMDDEYIKLMLKQKGKEGADELKAFKEKLMREWGI